jgi:hypothetical protein
MHARFNSRSLALGVLQERLVFVTNRYATSNRAHPSVMLAQLRRLDFTKAWTVSHPLRRESRRACCMHFVLPIDMVSIDCESATTSSVLPARLCITLPISHSHTAMKRHGC